MLDGLDSIPWKELTHAYGPAEDVPELLRALATNASIADGEESPLWSLFGNIWHQGTVYEATAYAVPFLIEIVSNKSVSNRAGILQLLADIAKGSSYRAVHGNNLNEPDFEQKKKKELARVADARNAVAAGLTLLVSMTGEQGEIRISAAHVLAQLPEQKETVRPLLHELLLAEQIPLYRAGFLLLLGQLHDRSSATVALLKGALSADDKIQRRAAVISLAQLKSVPAIGQEEILKALAAEDLEESFNGLPWDTAADVDRDELRACLDDSGKAKAVERLIAAIEGGEATHRRITSILDALFPLATRLSRATLAARELSPLQARAVRAIAKVVEGERRVFVGIFQQWRLPDTKKEWRDLAAGREPAPIDITLPLIADPENPRLALRPGGLIVGQRVLHRKFGIGTITETEPTGARTTFKVNFDDEGLRGFILPSDGSPPQR
jgi:hypothetical protein